MSAPEITKDLARLREPFPPEQVGLLPRVTCRDCSKNQCQMHKKAKCPDCEAWISPAHIHLDYVGHGAVTDRLLAVDPAWNWEPLRLDQDGMPAFVYDRSNTNPIEFWIKLTVCGVTRLGVGTCPPGQFDASKVLIGDALRNAAMRFGVALDLWIKGHAEDDERSAASDERSAPARGTGDETKTWTTAHPDLIRNFNNAKDALEDAQREQLKAWFAVTKTPAIEKASNEQVQAATAEALRLAASEGTEAAGSAPTTDEGEAQPPQVSAPSSEAGDGKPSALQERKRLEAATADQADHVKGGKK